MTEKIIEEIVEGVRERGFGSGGRALEDVLLLQFLTNPQGMDMNILPVLLLAGGGSGRRSGRAALITYLVLQQQQQAQAAATSGAGVPPQPANNLLPLLLALGFFEEGEGTYSAGAARRGCLRAGEERKVEEEQE